MKYIVSCFLYTVKGAGGNMQKRGYAFFCSDSYACLISSLSLSLSLSLSFSLSLSLSLSLSQWKKTMLNLNLKAFLFTQENKNADAF